jgi:hypothetical protein
MRAATPDQAARLGNDRAPIMREWLNWSRLDYQEYPATETWVWTSDFETVEKGKWIWSPGIPLDEGKWENETGQPLTVFDWLFLEESLEKPGPSREHQICRGGIVGFTTEE